MAAIFRRLDDIMSMICNSHDFYDPLSSLKNWCYMGQRIILCSTVQCNVKKPSTTLNALSDCQSSTSKFCMG